MKTQKSQFRVVVEEVEQLFKQFQRPNEIRRDMMDGNSWQTSYELGACPLDVPADKVSASGQSSGKVYSLHASVQSADKPSGILNRYKLIPPVKQLATRFSTKKVGEVIIVLDESKREEFVVHQDDSLLGWLKINAGGNGGYGSFNTQPKAITTLENFTKDIRKFAELIEVAVNGLYENFGGDSPDITLYLRPQLVVAEEESLLTKLTGGAQKQKDALKKVIEVENPHIAFSDVGGQEGAKREIQGISFALKNPTLYKRWGTKPPKGVLLVGPPGTGKTLMAKALASEAEAKFYHVKASDIASMWYGQSEKMIQAVFDLAREGGPSIIFFDELDALASQRDFSHEASQKVVSTMLENLDGLGSADNIMVVASTNRPEVIDPAIKRPGRIDRIVEVPLPDEQGRRQIFQIHFVKAEKLAERQLLNGVDYDAIVRETEKMSGADIAEVVRRVLEEKVRKEGVGEKADLVTTEDILREIKSYERTKKSQSIGFSAKSQATPAV